jgi:transcriptional regulator with XRE-family HTH domain
MEADDIRALRKRHRLSMKDLADHLSTEVSVVSAWESGTLYPTKKHVDLMKKLDMGPPPPKAKRGLYDGFLSDPRAAAAIRKLLAHEALQEELLRLADKYDDPADE